MANPEHLEILKQGAEVWNKWRNHNALNQIHVSYDLSGAELDKLSLQGISLSGTNLNNASLRGSWLRHASFTGAKLLNTDLSKAELGYAGFLDADLSNATLSHAKLINADFTGAILSGADLRWAQLAHATLIEADLSNADFRGAILVSANLTDANLSGANISKARIGLTVFSRSNLNLVVGIDSVVHTGPSIIDVQTLYELHGKVPNTFLLNSGVPDNFITFLPSLVSAHELIKFYSCFISYSHKDEDFAQRLYSRMREAGLRVWYAPEDMQGGRKLHEQIFGAIHVHDKLLLVLSENSLRSEWVASEIRRARKAERAENRRKLFPIRLVDFEAIREWECFDADTGKDLGVELREYFIPDFSDWKDRDTFEKAFERLLRDLKAEEKRS